MDVEVGAQEEIGIRLHDDAKELCVGGLGAEVAVDRADPDPLCGNDDVVLLA